MDRAYENRHRNSTFAQESASSLELALRVRVTLNLML